MFIVWPLIPHGHWIINPILIAWSIADINRFLLYICKEQGLEPQSSMIAYLIAATRYTIFIFNYPVGLITEGYAAYLAYGTITQMIGEGKPAPWSIEMPNRHNFAFSGQYFVMMLPLVYLIGVVPLYLHMLAQRKKFFHPANTKTKIN